MIVHTEEDKIEVSLPALAKDRSVTIDLLKELGEQAEIRKFVFVYKDITGKFYYETIIGERRLAKSNGIKKE